MKAKYFAFDVETTGLDPNKSEIISLSAILLNDKLEEVKSLNVYAMPERGCPPEAAKINGYTEESWKAKGALTQQDMYNKIASFVDEQWRLSPVGHNVSFDVAFLKALYAKFTSQEVYDKHYSWHLLDTLGSSIMFDIAKHGRKEGGYGLGKLCSRFGISLGEAAHDAKADIQATVELFRYLITAIRGETEIIPPVKEERKRPPFLVKMGEDDTSYYRINAGKFQGKTLGEVADLDKTYLMWILRTIENLDEDMKKCLEAKL